MCLQPQSELIDTQWDVNDVATEKIKEVETN